MGDPFVALDSYADAVASTLADLAIRATFAASAFALSVTCVVILARRYRKRQRP